MFLSLVGYGIIGSAQSYLHQVIVLNEGWSNWQTGEVMEPATMGIYDPGIQQYTVIDTLEGAGFVSDAEIYEGYLYVAADGQLLKYDIDSHELLQSVEIAGIRQLAMANGAVYVTRGDVDEFGMSQSFESYFQWFDATTLQWQGEVSVSEGPQYATEGIAVVGESIFVGINNAFDWGNEVGKVGRFNLETETYTEWDLGEEGKNPNRLLTSGNKIITVNNRDYGSTSLSVLDGVAESVETVVVSDANAGCLAAVMDGNTLKYQITGEGQVRATDINAPAVSSVWLSEVPAYYGVALDPTTGHWYGSVTDYSTYGYIEIRDADGAVQGQFNCGVSPGVICMDVRSMNDIIESQFDVLPPASAWFDILGRSVLPVSNQAKWTIDNNGRKILQVGGR